MTIRTRLTLQYTLLTAAMLVVFALTAYLTFERHREREFFHVLKKEAVTKAHLFLDNRVDARTMQLIYLNNREFIDEVEVAIYDTRFHLLYHDAMELDIIHEDQAMILDILQKGEVEFYVDDYQAIGLIYDFGGERYVVTAAALDGEGLARRRAILWSLILLSTVGALACFVVGRRMSGSALKPVADIVDEVEHITESNLDTHLPVANEQDEIGELAVTFNRMLDRLRTSFEAQKMFVSNVAHELRTPLTALVGEFELSLRKERTAEQYRETMRNAMSDASRLARLSGGLLDFARANYDPGQIHMEEVRLDELLLDAREAVQRSESGNTVELLFESDTDNERMITVCGNEYLLRTAFVNLIENNCKYSPNKTSHVRISYFKRYAVVRFEDTGIGIPPEDMEHIFTPFYRGANRQYADGTGIGLALVHRIVTLHGGQIRVSSQAGEGTVFTVELPHI